jgi:hypothetical protein
MSSLTALRRADARRVGTITAADGSPLDSSRALVQTSIRHVEDVLRNPDTQALINFIVTEATKQCPVRDANKEPTGWLASVPKILRRDVVASVNYLMMLVAIDFRHWGEEGEEQAPVGEAVRQKNFFAVVIEGNDAGDTQHAEKDCVDKQLVRGSAAMVYLLKRAVDTLGIRWFDPVVAATMSASDLTQLMWGVEEDGVTPMLMPAAAERVHLIHSLAAALPAQGYLSFFHLVTGLDSMPADGVVRGLSLYSHKGTRIDGILDRLLNLHNRYDDTSILPLQEQLPDGRSEVLIHFFKLSQLSIVALQNAFPGVFVIDDIDLLGVCSDYQLPKALRACGLIEYSAELSAKVDSRVLLGVNSREEIEIRVSSTIAAKRLQDWINANKLCNDHRKCDAALMDYALWYFGRSNKSLHHHLCRTEMY